MASMAYQICPIHFKKTLNKTHDIIPNKFNFLDDILLMTRGNFLEHKSDIHLIIKRLDEENLAIKLEKAYSLELTSHGSATT